MRCVAFATGNAGREMASSMFVFVGPLMCKRSKRDALAGLPAMQNNRAACENGTAQPESFCVRPHPPNRRREGVAGTGPCGEGKLGSIHAHCVKYKGSVIGSGRVHAPMAALSHGLRSGKGMVRFMDG